MNHPPPAPAAHVTPVRSYHSESHWPTSTSSAPDQSGESFIQDGRRYYWYIRDGRRFYTSHPKAGMVPADGPSGSAPPIVGGVPDLDSPLSPEQQAKQHALREKALQRLAATEQRIATFQRRAQHKIHQKAAKLRKQPKSLLR